MNLHIPEYPYMRELYNYIFLYKIPEYPYMKELLYFQICMDMNSF